MTKNPKCAFGSESALDTQKDTVHCKIHNSSKEGLHLSVELFQVSWLLSQGEWVGEGLETVTNVTYHIININI